MNKIFSSVLVLAFCFCASSVFAQNADIDKQSKELSDVNKTIKARKQERDKLLQQENFVKRELKNLNDSIEMTERKLVQIASDIKDAELKLSGAEILYGEAREKNTKIGADTIKELKSYNKMAFTSSYEDNPVEYKIRQALLSGKKKSFLASKQTVLITGAEVSKWQSAKKNLLDLKSQENALAAEKKKLIQDKNTLLKDTAGKRAAAEAEIKTLNENAKALQALIKKLSDEQKKKEKAKPPVIRPQTEQIQRSVFPWPVSGTVISQFGKQKHPEIEDTYVINNGIKIKAADLSQVKSLAAGTVVFAGTFRSYGKVVIIDHGDGVYGVYGDLDQILVKTDQEISRQSVIGTLGKGSDAVLYLEIRKNNVCDDPMLWLKK